MRQTVAVGVIKATTPKVVEGKATKAAQKADKKVSCCRSVIVIFLIFFILRNEELKWGSKRSPLFMGITLKSLF